ncbi:AsmA family protein [bacterium]|nr:AsmA family protein [bacterium]
MPKKKETPKTKKASRGSGAKQMKTSRNKTASKKPLKVSGKMSVQKSGKKSVAGKSSKKRGKGKVILILLIIILVIIGGGLAYLLTNLNFLVKYAIEKYGSQATQTAVRVKGVHISLKEGAAGIEGLTVANPAGFNAKHAFSLGEIGVDIDLHSLRSETIGIDEIVIRAPEIFVEVNQDNKNNLKELMKNLPAGDQKQSSSGKTEKAEKESQLFIRRILFEKARLYADIIPLNKTYDLKMRSIEMRNLRGTPAQIATQVILKLSNQALAEVKRKGVDQAAEKVRDYTKSQLSKQKKKLGKPLKKRLGL